MANEEEEIPNVNNPLMRFFSQDPVDADITSFSIGDVWNYMYREILIGQINQRNRTGVFLRFDKPLYNDGFTSQHLMTPAHIAKAVEDSILEPSSITYLEHGELVAHAFKAVAEELTMNVDERLMGKHD